MKLVTLALALALLVLAATARPSPAAETIQPAVSPSAEASRIFCGPAAPTGKTAPCVLRSIYVTTGATAGYLLVFNQATVPANGAVQPIECVVAPAGATTSVDFGETAQNFATGLAAVFSTTGCFTQTSSATAFFKARVQ